MTTTTEIKDGIAKIVNSTTALVELLQRLAGTSHLFMLNLMDPLGNIRKLLGLMRPPNQ